MIKVLHIITGLDTGGAEIMLYKLLSAMEQGPTSAVVVSLIDKGPIAERIEALGVSVYTLNMRRGVPSITTLLRMRQLVKSENPDLLQGWMYHGNLAASLAGRLNGRRVPVLWNVRHSLHDVEKEKRLTRWIIRLNSWLSQEPKHILYNSYTSSKQHEAFGFQADKSRVIPNGFDTAKFRPDDVARQRIRGELGVSDQTVLIGLVARFHPVKDHINFLRAVALLSREVDDVRFVLAGRDVNTQNKKLVDLVESLGLRKRVSLLGERSDIPALMAALDISSSSSWGEAFPNVVGEAMACGVPCVVTDVGDSAWIVDKTGRSTLPRNPEGLAQAWRELIDMGAEGRKRLGLLARQRIDKHFSLVSVAKKYESLYESVLS